MDIRLNIFAESSESVTELSKVPVRLYLANPMVKMVNDVLKSNISPVYANGSFTDYFISMLTMRNMVKYFLNY